MKIAVGNSRKAKTWVNQDVTFDQLAQRLCSTVYTTETIEEYSRLPKGRRDEIKDIGGFVGGQLKAGRRRKGMVLSRSCLTLDLDYATPYTWGQHIAPLPYRLVCHSTHRHTPENPRLRLVIPLTREVTEAQYPALARMFASTVGMDFFDDTTYEANRLMYWPSTSSNGEFFCKNKDGKLLDPDEYLGRYADWQDAATWPVSSRQSVAPDVAHVKKQADPRGKTGVVGAFCRTYTITDAIEAFLAGVYASTGDACRFDYIPADSSAGVVVYDDLFAYSHHATDPACGQLLNAFDLVRTHLFAHMDENQPADTPVSQLGSYQAMSQLVLDDARVKITLAEEKRAQAQADFNSTSNSGSEDDGAEDTQDAASGTDWRSKLEYERRTMVLKNTLGNLTLILENDEQLRSIVFNQQADGLEITGKVPWPHPSRFWRDQDDAQLVCYIDSTYGTFSQRNYQIAMTKVTDDRSYHPIRDYLSSLPAWDGVERVDTLLVDYLGAKDSAYTRAVTRKTLCAAIKRVQEPGCKFDSMLVLNGPQGIGKSTLIAKLAGQWFSDSLNLSDTKDKTAAEKLQGYWILEIGELAGLRKAEVETLRSFLSRQNDIYRAAYGRHATPHARQCVFFGTTNAESGYLRDTTGNRRFWPVHTPGGAPYSSWDITQAQVDQVWAEALTYVKAGETLYLQADLEYAAQNQQREAMETDDREGLIHAYLDTLLPENWDEMDLYTRRNFLDASNEFDTSTRSGTVRRESVSNIEIWCECLGKNRADITSVESNRIRAVLIKAGWVRSPHKKRLPLYGPQWIYTPPLEHPGTVH